jgi:carbon starvation protein
LWPPSQDTATRIQRYVIAELFGGFNLKALTNRYVATFIAVGTALLLAFATGAGGTGALKLWPLFGATNQTLAALALIIITLYLKRRGGLGWLIAGLPAIFMAVMTIWAVILNEVKFSAGHNALLTVINLLVLAIAIWILIEGVVKFFTTEEEPTAPAAPETA